MTTKASAKRARVARAFEAHQNVALTVGPVVPGLSLFCVTGGQFSMADVILHCLEATGPAFVSIWTWTLSGFEVDTLRTHKNVTGARLMIDLNSVARVRLGERYPLHKWFEAFGPDSVRHVSNHAKIATITSNDGRLKLLFRGSMNLNSNPRFEQFDLTEGGEDHALVRGIEEKLPPFQPDKATKGAFRVDANAHWSDFGAATFDTKKFEL